MKTKKNKDRKHCIAMTQEQYKLIKAYADERYGGNISMALRETVLTLVKK